MQPPTFTHSCQWVQYIQQGDQVSSQSPHSHHRFLFSFPPSILPDMLFFSWEVLWLITSRCKTCWVLSSKRSDTCGYEDGRSPQLHYFEQIVSLDQIRSTFVCKHKWQYMTPIAICLDVHMNWSTYLEAIPMITCILIISTALLISSSARNAQKSMFDKWKKASVGREGGDLCTFTRSTSKRGKQRCQKLSQEKHLTICL